MVAIKLKKILAKPEIVAAINYYFQNLELEGNICDFEENILLGSSRKDLDKRYPISYDDQVLGWVNGSKKVEALAQLINYIIRQEWQQKKLAQEVLDKYEELNLLYDISAKIADCKGIYEVTELIVEQVKQLIPSSHASVMILDEKTGELKTIELEKEDQQKQQPMKIGSGICGHVVASGKAEIVNNVDQDPRFIVTNRSIYSLICAPLIIQNKTIGVINVSHDSSIEYTTENLKLFTALTYQAAVAIQTARYYEQLKNYSSDLEVKISERTKELKQANQKLYRLATIDE
jgi:transcriptional regulator with GAF, ATPase, and Fis domain